MAMATLSVPASDITLYLLQEMKGIGLVHNFVMCFSRVCYFWNYRAVNTSRPLDTSILPRLNDDLLQMLEQGWTVEHTLECINTERNNYDNERFSFFNLNYTEGSSIHGEIQSSQLLREYLRAGYV